MALKDDIQLTVDRLSLSFGGIKALDDVTMQIPRGRIVGIIGPNGAGKSSLLNCINGCYRMQSGKIRFEGFDISMDRPHEIARRGIGRTFQGIELIRNLSVLENIMLGRHIHFRTNVLKAALYWGWGRAEEVRHRRRVEEIIEFLEIEHFRKSPVGNLSAGPQKLVEIGRALATDPKLLLLDEPSSGMNRQEKEDVASFMLRMKHELGLTQVLIEHDMRFVGDLCDYIFVLQFGRVIAEGPPNQVMKEPKVIEAYIGTGPLEAAESHG